MSGVTTAAVRGRPWASACASLMVAVLLAATAAPAGATTCEEDCESSEDAGDDARPAPRSAGAAENGEEGAPGLELEVVPVVGDEPDDGHLTRDEETGLATLTFSPSTPAEQTAVYAYTATNTGTVPLHDLEVVDDRLGTVLAAGDGTSLAPGEATTVRASAVFTFDEVASGLAGLLASSATATATDPDGTQVTGQDDAVVQLVAVLPAPQVDLELDVVVGAGDVIDDGDVPTLVWTAEAVAAGEARTVRYRITVTNTGPVTLQAVEVALDVLAAPVVAADDERTLEPGASFTVEVDRTVVPDDVPTAVATEGGEAEADLPATASLHATDDTGTQAVTATDEATVHAVLAGTDVRGEMLPAAGPREAAGGLLPAALLLLWMGVALLGIGPSGRVGAGRGRSVRAGRPARS